MPLPRRRLVDLLARSVTESVFLLVAPPGYGKSTVLAQYVEHDTGAHTIALSPGAADLETFVRDVIAVIEPRALRGIGALFAERKDARFRERLTSWFTTRLRHVEGTLIVDDFHRTESAPDVVDLMRAAVEATRERLRWIIASREMPQLPVGTWIARGVMAFPLTAAELAFTVDEAAALAGELDILIPPEALKAIVEDTNGWPLGVRLSLDVWTRTRGREPTKVRTREVLLAYIEDEVWSRLDRPERELIAACALLPSISPQLLGAAGYPDAGALLDRLCDAVPFISRQGDGTYAIHDVFREFIAERPGRNGTIARRLGQDLAQQLDAGGRPADALALLVKANSPEDVRALLARSAFDMIDTGERAAVKAAIAFLGPRRVSDDPVAIAIRAALSFSDGSGNNAIALYQMALKRQPPAEMRVDIINRLAPLLVNRGEPELALELADPLLSDPELPPDARAEISSFCAAALAILGRWDDAARSVDEVRRKLADVSPGARARALQRLGLSAFYTNDLPAAEQFSLDAAMLATELGLDVTAAMAFGTLCSVAIMSDTGGNRAIGFARSQAGAAERTGSTALHVAGLRNEFVLCATAGDVTAALAAETALSRLADARTHRDQLAMRLARALLYAIQGDARKASAVVSTLRTEDLTGPERAVRGAIAALLDVVAGNRDAAARAINRPLIIEATADALSRRNLTLAHAFRGVVLWALDRPAQARRATAFDRDHLYPRDQILVEALSAVTELPHPVPDLQHLEPMSRALRAAGLGAFAILLAQLYERDAASVLLTPAEIEVLRAFNEHGGRDADVARALHKSPHTVRTQIRNTIRKIGCSGRSEAIAYARKAGWLS